MRVAICTDIHGNRQAFEAVIAAAEAAACEELWCLGDLVGYGAEPDACVALARERCTICLAGNHDLAVIGKLDLDEFSRGAALAARWTQEVIAEDTREFLLGLEPSGTAAGIGLFHASPRDPIWEYVLSGLTAELCFDATDFRVSLIGHSHVALSFHRPEGEPRDGYPRAAWLLLDTERMTAVYRRAEYDIAGAQAAIRAARLPESLAERLQYGQ
jgi:predicted phosphodiesterase